MIKGAGRIVELAHYFEEKQINANIHIFGPVIEPYNAELDSIPNVSKHYSYIKSDLPDLMEKFEIDMVFIASICPETFSYTTQEAIEMEIPVAVFDLGAPAERVKAYRYGLILENDSPEYIYSTMRKYLDSLEKS
jgi:glycosyltransferase involved in cell wall biosynthesis